MAISKFEKRDTTAVMEIGAKRYAVDMAKDCVGLAIGRIGVTLEEIRASAEKRSAEESMAQMKQAYKEAINEILGDKNAAAEIFVEDDSLSFHDDILLFIQDEFNKVAEQKLTKYSPNRAQRRA